ncbi:ABC transporter permease subunit [Anaerohalosphaeraceae bacterium U12dextr]
MSVTLLTLNARAEKWAYLADRLGFYRVVGPILDKELRVTSRRKRYYFLRTAYMMLLTLMLAQLWFFTMFGLVSGSTLYQASRMSEVALTTTVTIIWFEFIVLQVLSVVMLSSAISDEIRKNTLDSLLSSPVTSMQIVLGKLFARLWQLMLLAGISMPILSILRSMGGVPWNFLIAGTCIVLTAAMTAGLISLWYSISRRPASQVIFLTLLTCLLLYVASPLLLAGLKNMSVQIPNWVEAMLVLLNPFVAFMAVSKSLLGAQSSASAVYPWPVHCLSMLGFCIVLMGLCIRKVRTVTTRHPVGFAQRWLQWLRRRQSPAAAETAAPRMTFPGGMNPVTRKDLSRSGLWGFGHPWTNIAMALTICGLYGGAACGGWLREEGFHIAVVESLIVWVMLQVMSLSARSIVVEKEARTWISLLTTPLSAQQILMGKVWAVVRRTMPVWLWIGLHLSVFTAAGVLNLLSLLAVPLELAGCVYFLLGLGMYFSARLNSSTAAVTATFALPIGLSMVCPCVGYLNPLIIVPAMMQAEFDEDVVAMGLFWFVRLIVMTWIGMAFLASAEKRIRNIIVDTR